MEKTQMALQTRKVVTQMENQPSEKKLSKGWLFSLTTQGSITLNDPSLL